MSTTPAQRFSVSEYVSEELEDRKWTVAHLAFGMEDSIANAQAILDGKHIDNQAAKLARAFGTSVALWDKLAAHELEYELHKAWAGGVRSSPTPAQVEAVAKAAYEAAKEKA